MELLGRQGQQDPHGFAHANMGQSCVHAAGIAALLSLEPKVLVCDPREWSNGGGDAFAALLCSVTASVGSFRGPALAASGQVYNLALLFVTRDSQEGS